jgi:hypothetical protein
MQLRNSLPNNPDEQKNPPELPIGRFLTSKSLGGNRVIFAVRRQEIMTQSKLLTVEGVFDLPGRGLIVVSGPLVDSFASPSEISVTLKRPDGQVIDATASITSHFQTPPPKEHRFAVILKGPAKSDVPIGTEIWFEENDDN